MSSEARENELLIAALLAEVARLEQGRDSARAAAITLEGNCLQAQAALAVARERDQPTRKALAALLARHVSLVESGDCGFWNVEEEPEVIAARAALVEPEQAEAQGEAAASRSGQGSLDGNAQGSGSASAAADEPPKRYAKDGYIVGNSTLTYGDLRRAADARAAADEPGETLA